MLALERETGHTEEEQKTRRRLRSNRTSRTEGLPVGGVVRERRLIATDKANRRCGR